MNIEDVELTDRERDVLEQLTLVWNLYVKLPIVHSDHQTEFRTKIHELQRLIAVRVARRVDPDIWSI